MSTIERAMQKQAGETVDEAAPTSVPPASAPPVPDAAPIPDAAPVAEAPVPATTADRADAPVASAAVSRTAFTPSEPTVSAERPTTHADMTRGESPGRNRVVLDIERMAAAGFLIPGQQTMTREAEEFQRIKRRLLGNMVPGVYESERPANLVLVTSSVPGEGKTFISTNLAISIALEIDRTVLAIDTDIVKRDMSKVFGVVSRPGLFDLLSDDSLRLEDLLVRTSIPNLTVLPAGNRRAHSTEMLASQRMRELTDEIATRYSDRVIVFDSPPVLAMTTASALAPLVGQIAVVCEAGSTKHETIRETLHRLEGHRVTGLILNKSKQAYASGYDYYGSYQSAR
ncbi:MAG: AAA family ATPase [Gammaproteobacteria bacterium]